MRELNCLRCGETMRALGQEELQLGKAGLLLGSLPNALAGSIRVPPLREAGILPGPRGTGGAGGVGHPAGDLSPLRLPA